MGRIKKTPLPKHDASLSPFLIDFNRRAYESPLHSLPSLLLQFPSHWPFPRGDLYHWRHLLNRFDDLLHNFIVRYHLDQGPQTVPFGRELLLESTTAWLKNQQQTTDSNSDAISPENVEHFLQRQGWGVDANEQNKEADRLLIESILEFSRLLMEKCGNRSLYNSSDCVNDLLNTTSLSLLQVTLRLGAHLAQRYYLRQRVTSGSSFHHSLLIAHYNIELDRVQRATMAFPRPHATGNGIGVASGKNKASSASDNNSNKKKPDAPKINANDVCSLFGESYEGRPEWDEWGNVHMTYFVSDDRNAAATTTTAGPGAARLSRSTSHPQHGTSRSQQHTPANVRTLPYFESEPQIPNTPSPLSRSQPRQARAAAAGAASQTDTPALAPATGSGASASAPASAGPSAQATTPSAQRISAAAANTPASATPAGAGAAASASATTPAAPTPAQAQAEDEDNAHQRNLRTLDIPVNEVKSTPAPELVKKYIEQVPSDSRLELLHRIRIAKALSSDSAVERRCLFAVRVLAITNLAYIYQEHMFQQRIFFLDGDEPKRLQFTFQLAELLHLAVTGDLKVDLVYATIACNALESLMKQRNRISDVCAALNINVGHGVLMFVVKKLVEEVADDTDSWIDEKSNRQQRQLVDEYRDSVFALLRPFPAAGIRTGDTLVSAGMVNQMVDLINLRTEKAMRVYGRVFDFLDLLVGSGREALTALVNAKGFDVTGNLFSYLVTSAREAVNAGNSFPSEFVSTLIDYRIPYFHQQSMKWMIKFVLRVMMSHSGHHDRVIRNFVDDARVLSALKMIFKNPELYGSHIWSNSVNLVATFLNNEPTSYSVVAEAGLPKAIFETAMGKPLEVDDATLGTGIGAGGQEEAPPRHLSLRPEFSLKKGKPDTLEKLKEKLKTPPGKKIAAGILPHGDVITCLPSAFSSVCLNTTGLRLFQSSDALQSFFEIFESPAHITAMKHDRGIVRNLGSLLDEFARHQPALRDSILAAVALMIARVIVKCRVLARKGRGAKLWKCDAKPTGEGQTGKVKEVAVIEVAGELSSIVDELPEDTLYDKAIKAVVEEQAPVPAVGADEHLNERDTDSETKLTVVDHIYPVIKFLRTFFENHSLCNAFMVEHGAGGLILDLATLSGLLSDFHTNAACADLAFVVRMVTDTAPHLVLPTLISKAQRSVDLLEPFWSGRDRLKGKGFFHPLADTAAAEEKDRKVPEKKEGEGEQSTPAAMGASESQPQPQPQATETDDAVMSDVEVLPTEKSQEQSPPPALAQATFLARQLVRVSTLCDITTECFNSVSYSPRGQNPSPFQMVNLADKYDKLVESLGRLRSACVWEEILLMKGLPESWKEATKTYEDGLIPYGLTVPGLSEQNPGAQARQTQRQPLSVQHSQQPPSQPQQAQPQPQPHPQSQSQSQPQPQPQPQGQGPTQTESQPQTQENTETPWFGLSVDDPKNKRPSISEEYSFGGRTPSFRRAQFLNVRTLRYLLANVPVSITRFMRGLGNGLVIKRRADVYARQKGAKVADAIARTYLQELKFETPYQEAGGESEGDKADRCMYLVVILSSFQLLMFDTTSEMPRSHCLTIVLESFKKIGGIKLMKDLADWFTSELLELTDTVKNINDDGISIARLASLFGAIKVVVTLFSLIVSSNVIIESNQTKAMVFYERDPNHGDYFNASQFLVELRHEVLRQVLEMWNSRFVEVANTSIVTSLVSTLESILRDHAAENGAARRNDKKRPGTPTLPKKLLIDPVRLAMIKHKGYSDELATEALYRCKNDEQLSLQYCEAQNGYHPPTRAPPQPDDLSVTETANTARSPFGSSGQSGSRDPLSEFLAQVHQQGGLPPLSTDDSVPPRVPQLAPFVMPHAQANDPTEAENPEGAERRSITPHPSVGEGASGHVYPTDTRTTIDDLDELRGSVRSNLVERCVEILDKHHDLTFPLARLIQAASVALLDSYAFHKDVIGTLIPSLISLQMEENLQKDAQKIASYANLLGILLQSSSMYQHTVEEVKESFLTLVDFIKIPPSTAQPPGNPDTAYPYIGQVLMVLESIMSDDQKPPSLKTLRANEDLTLPKEFFEEPKKEDPLVPLEHKMKLFNAILDILPSVGKSQSLALSISRMLVMLTRERQISLRLGERKNLQRLFVMMKQVAGASDKKLQCAFMIILRHIIEDEHTIRQIIASEISAFLNGRSVRQSELSHFIRHLYYLVFRSPDDFVQIVGEKTRISRYDPGSSRQLITIKEEEQASNPERGTDDSNNNQARSPQKTGGEGQAQVSGLPKEKNKLADLRTPVVEHPDGVIHYILSELLSYRDVEDKEVSTESSQAPQEPATQQTAGTTSRDAGTDASRGAAGGGGGGGVSNNQQEPSTRHHHSSKPVFKPDDHPIYIYRCFLLQCLSELLSSYNRTKIEFISFSRKADPFASTPSKPRSGILNYLLNCLIPIGTISHDESLAFKKRLNTSACAARVVVALCQQTTETGPNKSSKEREQKDLETGLVFVRKFVLEHALRAFKDAQANNEPLDAKYSRLLSLADLFDKMLAGSTADDTSMSITADDIAKMMFEKNFITVLTGAIADLDLDFPLAKRAVKYILRPLKKLTSTAVFLSENSEISTVRGQANDEDEISSATSVSSFDDDREETPDLFRHSTLGMFEHNQDEDSSSDEGSEEEEDEMYDDDGYDDGMDYDDEMEENDDDEVVSDEDEEDGHGPIEGLSGDFPMDVEVLLDDDDDEDEDEDEEDDEDEEGESDMEDDEIVAGEITGDNDNDSLQGGHEEEWESEDMSAGEGDGDEAMMEQFENDLDNYVQGDNSGPPHLNSLLRILDAHGNPAETAHDDYDQDEEDEEEEEEEDEGMDEDDDDDENENIIDDVIDDMDFNREDEEIDDDEDDYEGFEDEAGEWLNVQPHIGEIVGRPNRLGGRIPPSPWSIFPTATGHGRAFAPMSGIRSHGTYSSGRAMDGRNHLLDPTPSTNAAPTEQRPNTDSISDWVHAMDANNTSQIMSVDSPVTFLSAIIEAVSQGSPGLGVINRPDGVSVTLNPDTIPPRVQQLFGLHRPHQGSAASASRNDPSSAVTFVHTPTALRWQEEAAILFGDRGSEMALRIVGSLLRVLVPPAAAQEKERQRLIAEEHARREEAERIEREKREKEEAEKQRKKAEEEEKERQRREEEERAAAEERARHAAENPPEETNVDTQGQAQAPQGEAPAEPSQPVQRVYTTIGGRRHDITGLQIDPEYIEALPEDLREEVIMQQIAEQRFSQAAAEPPAAAQSLSDAELSEINAEFLAALPPEIREEILQAEAADRRRRQRESNRRETTASSTTAQASGTDLPGAVGTMEPSLRSVFFAEGPDDILHGLGHGLITEPHGIHSRASNLAEASGEALGDRHRRVNVQTRQTDADEGKKSQRKQIVQMLDRSGVCTLFRLVYTPMAGKTRNLINEILNSVCQNRVNRFEVLSILLLILREGSQGEAMLEKSYNQLTTRAKSLVTTGRATGSKKLPLPMSTTGEVTPLLVIQQCLSTLLYLTTYNAHISWFFLTEHDIFSALKVKAKNKGKHKEPVGSEFAVNSLLSLLDKTLIMDSPSCLEQLATILSGVTQPLTLLAKKEKEKEKQEAEATKKENQGSAEEPVPSVEDKQEPSSVQAEGSSASASDVKPDAGEEKDASKDGKHKKQHLPPPPFIPEANLRVLVNVLSAPECNGKTFRDTLSTITNISSIPGAKDTIGDQLILNSKALCISVTKSLNSFLPNIPSAESGTDIHGLALAWFNPASSDQAKLLRALTALDYLFNPSREESAKREGEEAERGEKLLKSLYESPEFTPMWAALSDVLTQIRNKSDMLNIAKMMLPLIESLMVVCKNTTLKEPIIQRTSRDTSVSTPPPPESPLEVLFFKFTEDHRKILNELVRTNPKLMSGSFSLLVRNPKVLEFDNKRNYFTRRLHLRTDNRRTYPPLQLSVRREQVFHDSFRSLYYKSADEVKYGKLNVKFHGEEGIDAGGVAREWFHVLARSMFNPDFALFIPVASDRTTFHPNRLSGINEEHLSFFKFIGRIISKAIYEGRVLDCHFSRAVYKRILGKEVSIKDMETLDLDYYKSLQWMLQNDITDIITETFSVETDSFGEKQIIDLIPNGRNIPVTQENKEDYIQKVVNYRLVGSVEEQLDNFLKGFHDIIPKQLISIFNEQELELLISGLPEIDIDDWKANSEYHNYSLTSPTIQWFWRAVRSFDKEERAKLLQFVTGTSKVPLNGFKELEGMHGFTKFNIHRDYGSRDRLPSSHTCFNQLDLPEYESYEELRQRLYTAMTTGSGYFGFA